LQSGNNCKHTIKKKKLHFSSQLQNGSIFSDVSQTLASIFFLGMQAKILLFYIQKSATAIILAGLLML